MMELSLRQISFAEQYALDRNGRQAAMRAGYAEKGADVQAVRLLRDDRIRAIVDQRCREASRRLEIELDDIIRGLIDALKQARTLERPGDQISALREIARLLGFYDRRPENDGVSESDLERRVQAMSDEQLLAIVREGAETSTLIDASEKA